MVRLHSRIARALEELYGSDAADHATELAHHYAEAEPVLGTEKLVHYSLLAGEQALATYAYEEGMAHFQRGLEATEGQPMNSEMAALLFGLSRAQAATFPRRQLPQVVETIGKAFDYYVQIGDVAQAVMMTDFAVRPISGHRAGLLQLVARALALVPPNSHEAGQLLVRYGALLNREGSDDEGAREALDKALELHSWQDSTNCIIHFHQPSLI